MTTATQLRPGSRITIDIDGLGQADALVIASKPTCIDRRIVTFYQVATIDPNYAADHRDDDDLWISHSDVVGVVP